MTSYVDRGFIGSAEAPRVMTWREVGSLRLEANLWKIDLLEYQRVSYSR